MTSIVTFKKLIRTFKKVSCSVAVAISIVNTVDLCLLTLFGKMQ